VQVGGHRHDTRHGKVEIADRLAERPGEQGDEAADAGVDMHPKVVLLRDRRNSGDRIHDAVRIGRRRPHEHDRARPDRRRHGVRIGAKILADGTRRTSSPSQSAALLKAG
jgi:hypothetical protein